MASLARRLSLRIGFVGIVGSMQCSDYVLGPPPEPLSHEEEEHTVVHAGDVPGAPLHEDIDRRRPLPGEVPIAWEAPPYGTVAVEGSGHVVYLHADDRAFWRVKATPGATPELLDLALDKLSEGEDNRMAMSRDGKWLVSETTRFGCRADPCVALFAGDLSRGERVMLRGVPLRVGASSIAIGAEGRLLVYGAPWGEHGSDLFSIVRTANGWTDPRNLSAASPYPSNHRPSLSPDARKVVFDCGQDPNGGEATALCEAAVDGTGFRVLRRPGGLKNLNHPSYAPDGTVVFERVVNDVEGEQIWRMSADGASEAPLNAAARDDHTPCVLPGGTVLSLYARRPGNEPGFRELKMTSPSGKELGYLVKWVDIADGLSCGN